MPIPMSARYGDNVSARSGEHDLVSRPQPDRASGERRRSQSDAARKPFRLPVQWVNRPNLDFRGFAGTVASGSIRPGDTIVVASSGKILDGNPHRHRRRRPRRGRAGEAVTLTLADEIDVARGDIFACPVERGPRSPTSSPPI